MTNPMTEKTTSEQIKKGVPYSQTEGRDIAQSPRRRRIRRAGPQPRLGFRARTEEEPTPTHGEACGCLVCQGLVCLERPNFFAGQLLSEAELNSQLSYLRAKNRLHNRYLHGWGVVCGLEVVCHPCEGWVTIRQGYAIDPCGEDILVCQDHDYNLVGALQDCLKEQRRRRRSDCDPYRPASKVDCPDDVEHWCITIAYDEKPARPITALRRVCLPGQEAIACEPTRTLESYRIDLVAAPRECCEDLASALRPEREIREKGPMAIGGRPESLEETFADRIGTRVEKQVNALFGALGDTLLERVVDCVVSVNEFISAHIKNKGWQHMLDVLSAREDVTTDLDTLYQDLLAFNRAVCLLYEQDPHDVQCAPIPPVEICPKPDGNGTEYHQYYVRRQLRPAVEQLMSRVIQYGIDCVCHELLPTCPPSPPDERLILACVDVQRNGEEYEILRICNTSCRRYAGAFPSQYSWMSLVPVVSLIGQLVKVLCCTPLAEEAAEGWPRGKESQEFFRLLADGEYGRVILQLYAEIRRSLRGERRTAPGMGPTSTTAPFAEEDITPVMERMAAERTEAAVRDYIAENFGELIKAPVEQQVAERVNERLAAEVGGHVERAVAGKAAEIDQQIATKVGESVGPAVEAAAGTAVAAAAAERVAAAADEQVAARIAGQLNQAVEERVAALEARFSAETANLVGELQAQLKKSLSQVDSLKKEINSLKRARKGGGEG